MRKTYRNAQEEFLLDIERFAREVEKITFHNTIEDIIPPPSDRWIRLLSVGNNGCPGANFNLEVR